MSLDAIARGARTGKAVLLAAGLGVLVMWWTLVGDPGSPQAVREVPGVITQVAEKTCVAQIGPGQTVRVFCDPRWRLAPGARVVLTATRYAGGDERYALTESGVPDP